MARRNFCNYVLLFISAFWIANGSALTTDYAVDTYSPASSAIGFLRLTPLAFTASNTIEMRIFIRENSQCIMSMGVAGLDNFFAIQTEGDALVVRVGFPSLPNFVIAQSAAGAVSFNTWQTISVIVTGLNSTNSQVSAFVDGRLVFFNILVRPFPSGTRQSVFLGNCQLNTLIEHPQGPQQLNGVVDNFRVWNRARTLPEIQSMIALVDIDGNLTSVANNQNLVAFFPFAEGRGLISRDLKNNGEATIGETTWVVKDLHAINRTCSADEGGLFITQLEESFLFFNPPQLLGQWQASSCGPNFVARVFRAPERAFSPEESCDVTTCGTTINNALTVKAFDDVFYISTMGYLSIAKFPGGPFVNQTFGSGVRPSGVRFNYTANSFKLQVPTIGFMLVDILPLVRGGTFPSFYIYNTNFCETLEIAGLCRSNTTTVTWDQFLFQAGESFCGDQIVSGSEQCDGTTPCLSNCACPPGMKAVSGLCSDDCGNGVVTGAEQCDSGSFCDNCKCLDGFKSTSPPSQSCQEITSELVPRIVPVLDCLDVLENGAIARLHFSYENFDGVRQVIELGKFNKFTPETFATSRPTEFLAGRSLAYPLSPYRTNITTSTPSFTWVLGSFNLTVDLTNPTRLQCPKAPEIEIQMTVSTNLTRDNVQTIIDNLAGMYGIDPSRINVTVVVDATTQPPTYTLIIVINSPTNATERDSIQVISDLFTDLKENEDETEANLTAGLEELEPNIKQITTRPTGVEVRGQPTNGGGDSLPVNGPIVVSGESRSVPLFSVLFVSFVCLLL